MRCLPHAPARALTRASLLARAPRQLRTGFKLDGRIYRVYPSGEVQYLHPKDGVYPEKLNKSRVGVNNNMRSIGKNVNPVDVRPRVIPASTAC